MKRNIKACLIVIAFMCTNLISPLKVNALSIVENKFVKIESGYTHSAAIDINDRLWMWGNNSTGGLGDGTTTSKGVPVEVMNQVKEVSAGDRFTVAIKNDNTLWAWGFNYRGQIGDGTGGVSGAYKVSPTKVMDNVKHVYAGMGSVYAIKLDDSLWAWGDNQTGQVGDGTIDGSNKIKINPVKIMDDVKEVSAGNFFAAAIKNDGSLWTWGNNSDGQLGDGTLVSKPNPVKVMDNVEKIFAGSNSIFAIKNGGELYAWGGNYVGQLGASIRDTTVPTKIMEDIKEVAVGSFHSLILKKDGTLWGCGRNNEGQLGNGISIGGRTPKRIMDNIKSVSAKDRHSLALKENGEIWSWGYNGYGELGNGTTSYKISPDKTSLTDIKDIESSLGEANNMLIKSDDTLWAWGVYQSFGEPNKIMEDVKMVSPGIWHKLVIKNDSTLWSWGENQYGELGDGTRTNRSEPLKIMDKVLVASTGTSSSFAVKEDGTLWSWGENWHGKLGIGKKGDYYTTVPMKVMEEVKRVKTGENCTFAIKNDDSLWAWGNNQYWQLGLEDKKDYSLPVKIMEDVLEVKGKKNTLVIKKDGSLWTFGNNDYGQLGDGTTESRFIPQKIMEDVYKISVGYNYSMAIKKDGSLWAWGNNEYGQLGNGTTDRQLKPVKIMNQVKDVITCSFYTAALKTDGTMWDWGWNKPDIMQKEFSNPVPSRVLTYSTLIDESTREINISVGETKLFKLSLNSNEYENKDIDWRVKNQSGEFNVYKEANGVFAGKDLGNADIEIVSKDGVVLKEFKLKVIRSRDVNKDTQIDILDLSAVASQYNKTNKEPNWNENLDINGDNIIDLYDLVNISNYIK
ncbi:dockerin type I domain-containing protein [Clostridium intestinale]|uniref:Alpha-tubulin suppressor n=1 Tax=Clostridium intestinale DSM 6191 TaxID=1121320 RepID=A0A1M6FH67_9CLOT|nr:dockerin type I domain-containing protein [Clostridium intestinale]SHI97003.1 Alpha-tubulin suppressor [Clostridium intestinale DSM 6191]